MSYAPITRNRSVMSCLFPLAYPTRLHTLRPLEPRLVDSWECSHCVLVRIPHLRRSTSTNPCKSERETAIGVQTCTFAHSQRDWQGGMSVIAGARVPGSGWVRARELRSLRSLRSPRSLSCLRRSSACTQVVPQQPGSVEWVETAARGGRGWPGWKRLKNQRKT